MYFIGTLTSKRKIDSALCFPFFALADQKAVPDAKVPEYVDKLWLWEASIKKVDRRGNDFYICQPIRKFSSEDLPHDYTLEEMLWSSHLPYAWDGSPLCQIRNLEEFVDSGYDEKIIVAGAPSMEIFNQNKDLWVNKFVKGSWGFDVLDRIYNMPMLVSWDDIWIQAPGFMPKGARPTWCSRRGVVGNNSIFSESGLFYQFGSSYHGVYLALTQEEIMAHADRFYPPVAITVAKDFLIFAPKLWEIKGEFTPVYTAIDGSLEVSLKGIEGSEFEWSLRLDSDWVSRHMELFPGFQFLSDRLIPADDQPFEVGAVKENRYLPGSWINVYFPNLQFSAYLRASTVFSRLKGKCLNADIYKEGNSVESLRIYFKYKDAKPDNAQRTSLF